MIIFVPCNSGGKHSVFKELHVGLHFYGITMTMCRPIHNFARGTGSPMPAHSLQRAIIEIQKHGMIHTCIIKKLVVMLDQFKWL